MRQMLPIPKFVFCLGDHMKKLYAFFLLFLIATTASASGVIGSMIDPTARANAIAAQTTANTALAAALPVGAMFDFTGSTCPTGSLIVPTTAGNISRTTYAALYAAIGTTWGAGDGSTTFGRPWMAADYSAVQANANVGTASVGQVIAHTHDIRVANTGVGGGTGGFVSIPNAPISGAIMSTGGTANLAAGVRVLKCVKY